MTAERAHPADLQWRWDKAVPLRWLLIDEFTMNEPADAVAVCADIEGLLVDTPTALDVGCAAVSGHFDSAMGTAKLIGCRPAHPLQAALDALARGAGNPSGALHRRRIIASIYSVAEDGTAVSLLGSLLSASVAAARPSSLADGLLDVTFDGAVAYPMPRGASQIWELWRAGRPAEPSLWADYDSGLRHQWAGAALAHRPRDTPDKPAGTTYHLDGRNVTDYEGFNCAIGEAINGPGGYFGWNGDALFDCLRGGWGATPPLRLIWHDAAVARKHLVAASVGMEAAPAITFDQILQWLTRAGAEVELR